MHDLLPKQKDGAWQQTGCIIHYSMRQLHDGISVNTHRGVKALLGKHYILTGKMSNEHSIFLAQMETLRDKADYNVLFVATREDVVPNLQAAEDFLKEVERIIK